MVDVLLQIGVAKLLVSGVLAGLALVVQRRVGHPGLHSQVLVAGVGRAAAAGVGGLGSGASEGTRIGSDDGRCDARGEHGRRRRHRSPGRDRCGRRRDNGPGTPFAVRMMAEAKAGVVIMWLVGTALLLGWTLFRVLRFRHWLVRTSQPAPPELRDEVAGIGRRLGLAGVPAVHITTARVSPMVCWAGGRVRIVVPSFLLATPDRQALRAMLAHELAHVRRRDHFVRWIEWLACSVFWWNPVAWWARRELRAAEEASCDALGASVLQCAPDDYGKSLLRVVELMSNPPTPQTPAFASGAAGSRSPKALERRFRMLISGKSTVHAPDGSVRRAPRPPPRLLPLGLVYCGFADQPTPTAPEGQSTLRRWTDSTCPTAGSSQHHRHGSWKWTFRSSRSTTTSWRRTEAAPPRAAFLTTHDCRRMRLGVEPRRGDDWGELLKVCAALSVDMRAQQGSSQEL